MNESSSVSVGLARWELHLLTPGYFNLWFLGWEPMGRTQGQKQLKWLLNVCVVGR